jgi:hypothetical protein
MDFPDGAVQKTSTSIWVQIRTGVNDMRMGVLAAMAVAATAVPAAAAPVITFQGGVGGNAAGTKVIQNFDSLKAGSSIGNFAFAYGSTNERGIRPAFGSTGNFGAALGGGTYSINFNPATNFSFVLGSLDQYNLLILKLEGNKEVRLWGNQIIGGAAYVMGSATSPLSNGLVSFNAGNGPLFVGATFMSETNSFEFDNIAAGVPEPATWALMILGFGAIGGAMRRRKAQGSLATA